MTTEIQWCPRLRAEVAEQDERCVRTPHYKDESHVRRLLVDPDAPFIEYRRTPDGGHSVFAHHVPLGRYLFVGEAPPELRP